MSEQSAETMPDEVTTTEPADDHARFNEVLEEALIENQPILDKLKEL